MYSVYWVLLFLIVFVERHQVVKLQSGSGPSKPGPEQIGSSSAKWYHHALNPRMNDRDLAELGFRYFNRRKYTDALNCYNKAIKKSSSEAQYYKLRGDCYLNMGNVNAALIDYRNVIEKDPDDERHRIFLIHKFFDFGKFKEAIDDLDDSNNDKIYTFEESVILNDTEEFLTLGNKFFQKKKFDEALVCFTHAIQKNPSEASHYRLRGNCYFEMQNTDRAIADFKEALSKNPQYEDVRIRLCRVLFDLERYDEAIRETFHSHDVELMKLGDKLLKKNKFEEAIRCYTEAIRKNPTEAAYYGKRGQCYQKIRNLDEAIVDYMITIEMAPLNLTRRIELVDLLLEAKRFDEAKEVIENTNQNDLWGEDILRVERARRLIKEMEEVEKKRRIENLLAYSKDLILQDITRKIVMLNEASLWGGFDEETQSKTKELELLCDDHLEKLTYFFSEYQRTGIPAEPVITPTPAPTEGDDSTEDIAVPDYMLDKITFEIMTDPVITPSGVTYERAPLVEHLNIRNTDPMTRAPLVEGQLRPNLTLKQAIDQWNEENTHASAASTSRN